MADPIHGGKDPERWVRRCPEHKTQLVEDGDRLFCYGMKVAPGASPEAHLVEHPEVWDRWKGRVNTEGLPNDTKLPKTRGGGGQRVISPRAPKTPPKGQSKMAKQTKVATLDRAKYRGEGGGGLFLRLMKVVRKSGDPYQVKWTEATTVSGLGQKGTTGGVSATAANEAGGKGEFNKAKATAQSLGWKPIAIAGRGSPRLELKPIPAPKKRPGRKPQGHHTK